MSITPSGFHDQAYRRDAGHDAMQQAFLDWLRTRPIANLPPRAAVHRHVEGEYPLWRNGQIVAYADAAEVLTVNLTVTLSLFEINPRIHTVFGVVRQAKALEALARSVKADFRYCHIVVKAEDPLLADLRKEWPRVWAWGVIFEPMDADP